MLKSLTKKLKKSLSKLKDAVWPGELSNLSHDFDPHVATPIQVFYVCFSDAGDYWLKPFIKKNFTHVSVMERVPLGFIVHDPNQCALDTYILPEAPTEEFLKSFLKKRTDYTILEITKEASRREMRLIRFGLQSCVSIVAYIMSIRLPWYHLTPYRLYLRLLKGGDGIINIRKIHHG